MILMSLVIVTIPREWVHECDHQAIHQDGNDHDGGTELSQDDCFACEYDLDYMESLVMAIPVISSKPLTVTDLSKLNKPHFEESGEKQRRGPPYIG